MDDNSEILENMTGAFADSLRRNNKQIKSDRAIEIAEAAELKFKRTVEDLKGSLQKLLRKQKSMLDLSPEDKNTLILGVNFKEEVFVNEYLAIGLEIRNTEIKLEIAEKSYAILFGATAPKTTLTTSVTK